VPIVASTFVTGMALSLGEAALRVLARPHPMGVQIGEVILRPFHWPTLVRTNLELLNRQRELPPFLVPDPDLGWTVGVSRIGANSLYKSSAEGLRSASAGEDLRGQVLASRVALFGDSFTFSNEVPFEESLGYHLQNELDGSASVLNFGVSGYGLDQAFLRFKRDGLAWSPTVAVLSFIEPDLLRMASVYLFLKVNWKLPLSKPRFVLNHGELEIQNRPTLTAKQIFGHSSIQGLPYLGLDVEFSAHKWQAYPLDRSYILRYLASSFPPRSRRWAEKQEEVLALAPKVIEAFIDTARAHGVVPVVAYLPTTKDVQYPRSRIAKARVLQPLKEKGVRVEDLTGCVGDQSPIAALYHTGGHHTNTGNIAVAKCFKPIIADALRSSAALR